MNTNTKLKQQPLILLLSAAFRRRYGSLLLDCDSAPSGVPINLAVLGVLLSAGCLGFKYGTLTQLVYVLLGCVGLPVFAGV